MPSSFAEHLIKLPQLPAACINSTNTQSPLINFNVLWRFFDDYYPAFKERLGENNLSWRDIYEKYNRKVNPDMTSQQLFQVMASMLTELHDAHIDLYLPDNPEDNLDINDNERNDIKSFNQALEKSYNVKVGTEAYNISVAKSIIDNFKVIDSKYLIKAFYGTN